MTRLVLFGVACLSFLGCGEAPSEEPTGPAAASARRVTKVDAATLKKRAERTRKEACACEDAACADRAMSHLMAFARRESGITLGADDTNAILAVADEAIACAAPLLNSPAPSTPPHD